MTPDERFQALDDEVTAITHDLLARSEAVAVVVLVLDPPWFGHVTGSPALVSDMAAAGTTPERVAAVLRRMADELDEHSARIVAGKGAVVRSAPSPVKKAGN